jgi:hypothetical protein
MLPFRVPGNSARAAREGRNVTIDRKKLAQTIHDVLMSDVSINRVARGVERLMNTEIPGTPRLTGRGIGGRVMYVALPGRGKAKTQLSARAKQVMAFIERNSRMATSAALQGALRVNRNVIAGAIHELKQAGVIRTEVFNEGGREVETAHSYHRPRSSPKKKSRR